MSAKRPAEPPGHPGPVSVYIGLKPTMTYVFQVVAQLNSGSDPVVVRARGNAIAKAVDVVEVVRHRFLEGQVEVGRISTDTERLTNRDGRDANVSAISIPLSRVGPAPMEPMAPTGSPPKPE
jgi:archaea-specific DNA-binding protein